MEQGPKIWRLIPPIQCSGTVNMAVDRWLLEQHGQGLELSCLRFYTWSPTAISLGYHQKRYPPHWPTLTYQNAPIELVRRPTGGRAVLHQGDLTYAIVTSQLAGKRMNIYKQLCQFLIQGWQALGVTLDFGKAGHGYIDNPNCFGTATTADLVMAPGQSWDVQGGYKLIGSAQVYRNGCLLQHGSMRLAPDPVLLETVFGETINPDALQAIRTCLAHQTETSIIRALVEAAERCFEVQFDRRPLSDVELEKAIAYANVKPMN